MSDLPSMPLFIDAYLADTTHLATEEHGAYLLLMMAMWRRRGWVPDDDIDNARMTGLTKHKWLKMKSRLHPLLIFKNGEISQKRILKEWQYALDKKRIAQENGAKGGRPKTVNKPEDDVNNGATPPNKQKIKKLCDENEKIFSKNTNEKDTCHPKDNNDLEKPKGSVQVNPEKSSPSPSPLVSKRDANASLVKDAMEIWNKVAMDLGLPKAVRLTEKRKRGLNARLKDCGGLDEWQSICDRVRICPHLIGQNNRGWVADLDFILREDKFTKLIEGSYDKRKANGNGKHQNSGNNRNQQDETGTRIKALLEGHSDYGSAN